MISVLKWIFWISFGLGVYVYFIYPALLWLFSLFVRRPADIPSGPSDEELPTVAHLIACYNEESEIEGKIANCMSLDYPPDKVRLLILSDGSTDRTVEIAKGALSRYPGRIAEIFDSAENLGKSGIVFRGVDWVRKNWPDVKVLAFSDANSRWEPLSLRRLIEPFSDPKVAGVSGLLRYMNPDGTAAGEMEGLYWKYEAAIKRLSSRLGSLPGGNGSIFAIRLSAYRPLSEKRGDDFELPIQAIIDGYRSVLVEQAVSRELPSTDFLSEYRRKLRITGQMMPSAIILFWRAIARGRVLIMFQLFSHKILRYLVPLYQILLLLSSAALWNYAPFYLIAFFLQMFFYALAATGFLVERAGFTPHKVLQVPLYFTMVNLACLVSMVRLALGHQITWERNR